MRDYYKILGVKENASEEEIRARWVELTKQHHPDRLEDASSDQRIREINEAYQVLKHSSTRVEYDLKRTYGKEARKKTAQFKRWGVSAGILIIFIIIGVIYLVNHQPSPPPTSVVLNESKAASTHSRLSASTNHIDQLELEKANTPDKPSRPSRIILRPSGINQRNEMDQRNQKSKMSPPSRIDSSTHLHINQKDQKNQKNKINQIPPIPASTHQRISASTQIPSTDHRIDASPHPRIDASSQSASSHQRVNTSTPQRVDSSTQTTSTNQTDQKNLSREMQNLFYRDQTDQLSHKDEINQRNQIDQKNQFNVPSVMGTEDEVRKFFNIYVERYNRMDLEGLFSLFSSEAVQNKKDGMQNIRKIYTNFFNQGREVRYRVQDMKIEIYQNAVEVKARYEIDQILRMGERMVWKGNVQWTLGKENGALKIRSLDYQHQQIY